MSLNGSIQVKTIALAWSGNTRVYQAGQIRYRAHRERESFQLIDGENIKSTRWIHLSFDVTVGYFNQQLNAGQSYTLANQTSVSSAPATGLIDILQALESQNVLFFPILETGQGGVNQGISYQVLSDDDTIDLLQASRAGIIRPYQRISLITKNPISQLPSWANR